MKKSKTIYRSGLVALIEERERKKPFRLYFRDSVKGKWVKETLQTILLQNAKELCRKKAADQEAISKDEKKLHLKNASVKELFEYYIRQKAERKNIKASSIASERSDMTKVMEMIGDFSPENLSKLEIQNLKQVMEETLAPSTLKRKWGLLRTFFKWLREEHLIFQNPTDGFQVTGVLSQGKEPKRDDEIMTILGAALDCSPEHLLFCLLILESGLRPSEVEHLPWEFIEVENPEKAQIRLPLKQEISIKGKHIYDFEVKSSRRPGLMVVQISKLRPAFASVLREIKAKRHSRYVFSDWIRDSPIASRSVMNRKLKDINDALPKGANGFQFKNFRDTNVNLRLSRGEKLEHIAKQLGHRSFFFTYERYFHLIDGDVDQYPKYEQFLLQLQECQWLQKWLKITLKND